MQHIPLIIPSICVLNHIPMPFHILIYYEPKPHKHLEAYVHDTQMDKFLLLFTRRVAVIGK